MPAFNVEITGKEAAERKLMRVKNYIGSGSVGVKYKWVAHGASQADQELQKEGEREEKARMMLVKVKRF